jgi:hypothetical protein
MQFMFLFLIRYEVEVCPELPCPTREQISERISGNDGVLWSSKVKVDSEMLDKAGKQILSYRLFYYNFGT